jgi:hypothetical protein
VPVGVLAWLALAGSVVITARARRRRTLAAPP